MVGWNLGAPAQEPDAMTIIRPQSHAYFFREDAKKKKKKVFRNDRRVCHVRSTGARVRVRAHTAYKLACARLFPSRQRRRKETGKSVALIE